MPADAFVLDEDHVLFQQSVRQFARAEFFDTYLERATNVAYPLGELKKLAAAGLTGLCLPERLGGQDADLIALALTFHGGR